MSSFGDRLEAAREARGLSLEEVAEATRIAPHHLRALERGDLGALPAGPFAKGYIEACARVLDIDPGPILEAYRAEARQSGLDTAGSRSRTLEEMSQLVGQRPGAIGEPGRGSMWAKVLATVIVGVALVGIVAWLVMRAPGPGDRGATPSGQPATERPREDPALQSRPRGAAVAGESASPTGTDNSEAPPPAPTPDPTPEPTVAAANPAIEVPDFGVGTGVESHRLVGVGDRFPEGGEVVFWTRVLGADPGDVIHHVWLHEGRGIARIPLRIGGSHWRTYSRRLLPRGSTGRWTVEARGLDGRLLARQEFLCVP